MSDSIRVRAIGLCSMVVGLVAFAYGIPQPAHAEPRATAEDRSATAVSEPKLDAFARSYVRLAEVRADHGELGSAEAQSDAAEATVEVLEQEGLSPPEYNEILSAVNADPDLRDRAMRKIEAER